MVSTAFFKGIIILTRQINFYRNEPPIPMRIDGTAFFF